MPFIRNNVPFLIYTRIKISKSPAFLRDFDISRDQVLPHWQSALRFRTTGNPPWPLAAGMSKIQEKQEDFGYFSDDFL